MIAGSSRPYGRADRRNLEPLYIRRFALILVLVAALIGVAGAHGGGISDSPCPTVRGEHTNTCRPGTIGAPYSLRFVEREGAGCGPGAQTFHFDSGELPPGLTLAPDGTLNGTPTHAGSFRFYVEMREPQDDPEHCAGKRTQKQFTLVIRKPPSITSTPAVPPASEVGMRFRLALRARGGSKLFTWETIAGTLPLGVRLRADGSIVGIPRTAGTFRFVARARDTEGRTAGWPVVLRVAPALAVPARQPLPPARVARFYDAEVTATGGVAPQVWTLVSGRLPRGLHFATGVGRLTGTPRENGTFLLTLKVRDRLNATFRRTLALVVRPRAR